MQRKIIKTKSCRKINTISELPLEVILEIFSYVSVREIKTISLVCKHWLEITQHQSLEKRLKFIKTKGVNNFPLNRTLYNVVLRYFNYPFKFSFGNRIEYLELKSCTFCEVDLLVILSNLTFLKSLSIRYCCIAKPPTEEQILSVGLLENMKELKLSDSNESMYNFLNILLCLMPNVDNLEMNSLSDDQYEGAQVLLKHIKLLSPKLKHLTVNCLYEANFLKQLADVAHLQLLTLCIEQPVKEIGNFLLKQQSLTSLIINDMYIPYDDNKTLDELYSTVFNNLLNLKTFILRTVEQSEDSIQGNEGIKYLWKLRKLEVLELSVFSILKENLLTGLLHEKIENLKKLSLYVVEHNILPEIALSYKNLTTLEIHITTEVTNNDFQIMWKNLQSLRVLRIWVYYHVEKITDYAFSGIPETENQQIGYSIAELKHLRILHLEMQGKQISSKIFVEISKVKHLIKLEMWNIFIDPLKYIWCLKKCKMLEDLQLREMFNIKRKHIVRVKKEFLRLKCVYITLGSHNPK